MDVNRNIIKRLNMKEDIDDGYVKTDKAELLSVMWEITKDAWSSKLSSLKKPTRA